MESAVIQTESRAPADVAKADDRILRRDLRTLESSWLKCAKRLAKIRSEGSWQHLGFESFDSYANDALAGLTYTDQLRLPTGSQVLTATAHVPLDLNRRQIEALLPVMNQEGDEGVQAVIEMAVERWGPDEITAKVISDARNELYPAQLRTKTPAQRFNEALTKLRETAAVLTGKPRTNAIQRLRDLLEELEKG